MFVHLAALCAVLERGWPPERAIDVRGEDYDRRAWAWARSVWEAWGDAREMVRARVARL